MSTPARPELLLLLYSDRSDAVTSAVIEQRARFGLEVHALSLEQLLNEVAFDERWSWRGHRIDPARTAVVNRLASLEAATPNRHPSASGFQKQLLWIWLRDELRRFAYASSLPTVHSPIGGYGSLLDQWLDLPEQMNGLRVPSHQIPWNKAPLNGDVYVTNPWNLYSLGRPIASAPAQPGASLAYTRPRGSLVHVSQVGRTFLLANVPPTITQAQTDYLEAFARAMALHSTTRIMEHAFFVADDLPVFFATCPMPVVTGGLPLYPDLVAQGLHDDIDSRGERARA